MVNQNKEYYLGLYEKSMPNTLSWEEKLKVVKEAGFDYLEMSIDETEEKLARLDHRSSYKIYLLKWSSKISIRLT